MMGRPLTRHCPRRPEHLHPRSSKALQVQPYGECGATEAVIHSHGSPIFPRSCGRSRTGRRILGGSDPEPQKLSWPHSLFGAVEGPELGRRFVGTGEAPDQLRGAPHRVRGGCSPEAKGSPRSNPAPSTAPYPLPSPPAGWSLGAWARPAIGDAVLYWWPEAGWQRGRVE
jgi:hypothetical protein